MSWVAASTAAVAIGSGLIQKNAAEKAADSQSKASQGELGLKREVFEAGQEQQAPVLQARNIALSQLLTELGLPGEPVELSPAEFETRTIETAAATPDQVIPGAGGRGQDLIVPGQAAQTTTEQVETTPAEFFTPQAQQGLTPADQFAIDEAIKSAQIATGGQLGGRELRALTERTQNIATLGRERRLDRLANLAGLTQSATTAGQTQALQGAQQVGGALQNLGQTRASGFVNQSNALTGTLQNLSNLANFQGGQGGFTGTQSPGVQPGVLPQHLRFGG
jgi:hypothetical protein